ncbi:MAG: hypothetical protein BAJALOKI3v1_10104 [Promethearchaeota archaeon]|nr:MAG: hypothetical protein BAJALOKI3v1_10104 [Candidatus Lokiarchaeota archaeon]
MRELNITISRPELEQRYTNYILICLFFLFLFLLLIYFISLKIYLLI